MKCRLPLALALVALALLASLAAPVHAGWGDALKQKASKVLKTEKPKPAAEAGPVTKSGMTPEVTAERLDRFQKGMEVEVAELEKAKKILASLPDKATRDKCMQQLAASPEAQKVMTDYALALSSAKPEDGQKVTQQMSEQLDALATSKCGPDPGKYDANRMSRDALAKGSDTAALGDDLAYRAWKEWALEFCNYTEKLLKQPDGKAQVDKMKTDGLRIPGSGTGIFFVYTASEATLLLERCPKLQPLLVATY
jgi:hypothetical protein